jgi:hypothetical protein
MAQDFYAAVAQASFTLLGLWWVLLQIRHDAWFSDAAYRWAVYDVSLYFLLPGMMGLASLLAVGQASIWRVSFAVLGAAGAFESALSIAGRRPPRGRRPLARAADWLSLVLYALIAVVGIWRSLPTDLGLGLRPLEAEGILVTLLLLLGITLAAELFVTTGPRVERPDEPSS